MYSVVIVLIVLAAVLMCLIVLIQESKGGGLAAGFSNLNAMGGVRKTTDFVEKATWGLAIAMVVLSIAAAYLIPAQQTVGSVMENAPVQTAAPALPNPTQQTTAPAPVADEEPAAEGAEAPAAE
ncbi:MAG: preprotein translocase subunit SecG [Prevotellaceae bacterium]|nr:preprotein translocase subunit SecG [Prevotellaceae bacterium]